VASIHLRISRVSPEDPTDMSMKEALHRAMRISRTVCLRMVLEHFFIWLGRFVPEKGAHLAIEAAKKAGVSIVLAGTIDPYIQESVGYFEQMIQPHIDNRQVRYVGPVDREQKIDLLSRARGLLNPIQWEEPFGMVMIEAMAVGCPIIVFNRGAASEIVVHRKSGFLVQGVNEMAQCIARIDELDRRVVRAHVERNFTAQAMAQKYTEVYKQVIASSVRKALSGHFSYQGARTLLLAPSTTLLSPSPLHVKTNPSVLMPYQASRVVRHAMGAEENAIE
jgi:glycosyltransferase involved in cell wall biosynthesis